MAEQTRLERQNGIIAGVCGGIAARFGWSPFVPGDADKSSLPVGALEYRFVNPTGAPIEATFSYHSKNFMETTRGAGTVLAIENGFVLHQEGSDANPENQGSYAVFVDEAAVVDHCWFKGGWWDAATLAWRNVQRGAPVANPPLGGHAPGASLYVPLKIGPGEERTVRLLVAWYVPTTNLRLGQDDPPEGLPARHAQRLGCLVLAFADGLDARSKDLGHVGAIVDTQRQDTSRQRWQNYAQPGQAQVPDKDLHQQRGAPDQGDVKARCPAGNRVVGKPTQRTQ